MWQQEQDLRGVLQCYTGARVSASSAFISLNIISVALEGRVGCPQASVRMIMRRCHILLTGHDRYGSTIYACGEESERLKSPDLNAIENAWQFLRSRLDDTRRPGREAREPFLVRLRAAVAWINKNHGLTLRKLCRNQRLRASVVLAQDGFRTKW